MVRFRFVVRGERACTGPWREISSKPIAHWDKSPPNLWRRRTKATSPSSPISLPPLLSFHAVIARRRHLRFTILGHLPLAHFHPAGRSSELLIQPVPLAVRAVGRLRSAKTRRIRIMRYFAAKLLTNHSS